ncbi:MAG: sigma-70 family RNA polymerase sigma factor [Planctomycetaceae bacterium]|nr:sigma-70 family RNA polymerase sigma factor [Planctomycetaceae bacterium]
MGPTIHVHRLLDLPLGAAPAVPTALAEGLVPKAPRPRPQTTTRSGVPASPSDATATRLMAMFRDTGSDEAFEALYAEARGDVTEWVRSLLRQGPAWMDVAEIVQDTFVNVYRYPSGFRDDHPASFRVWVRTIAGNLVRRARSRRPREGWAELPVGSLEPADARPGPDQLAGHGEEASCLRASWALFLMRYLAAWNELSARDRLALDLVEVQHLSYTDAAERLGVRASNMKMIVFRSRKRLFARMRLGLAQAMAA